MATVPATALNQSTQDAYTRWHEHTDEYTLPWATRVPLLGGVI
jgi:hypothetical protein